MSASGSRPSRCNVLSVTWFDPVSGRWAPEVHSIGEVQGVARHLQHAVDGTPAGEAILVLALAGRDGHEHCVTARIAAPVCCTEERGQGEPCEQRRVDVQQDEID
jgi:hypothetical protein